MGAHVSGKTRADVLGAATSRKDPFVRLHSRLADNSRPLPAGLKPFIDSESTRLPVLASAKAPVRAPLRQARVSVVIPCYNYGRFLNESVPSALSQAGVSVEVIIVDDGSTDGSAQVAEEIAAADVRVRVLRNDVNQGHVRTFNNGARVATGEFVVRLDADDLLTPGSLARAVALFDAHPSVGLVYGHPRHFDGPVPEPRLVEASWTVWRGEDWLAERCRTGVNCITTPEAIVRKSVLDRIGLLSTELRYAQDMEMWLRVSAVSDVGRINGPDQALHRDHAASMSATDGSGILTDLRERRRVFEVLFAGPGSDLERASEYARSARRALATNALDRACRAYDRGRAHIEPVQEYIDFALDIDPDIRASRRWQALVRRQRWSGRPSATPHFMASAAIRRLRDEAAYGHWVRTGI